MKKTLLCGAFFIRQSVIARRLVGPRDSNYTLITRRASARRSDLMGLLRFARNDNAQNIIFFLLLVLLTSCSSVPRKGVPLKDYIQALKEDISCLRICSAYQGIYNFALLDPLDISLYVSSGVSASAKDALHLPVYVEVSGNKSSSGSLGFKLYPVFQAQKFAVHFEKNGKIYKDIYSNGFFFFKNDQSDKKVYLYVYAQKADHSITILKRYDFGRIVSIEILKPLSVNEMSDLLKHCQCNGKDF